jgi:ubiquitin-conjugating enzyme E2 J2
LVRRVGTLHFHFCLHGLEGAYSAGLYHGLLELDENYPFRAPKLYFYTPSGRFEVNTPICTSFTSFHQETWTSAWNVRTLIIATISFMYSEEPSFGARSDSIPTRQALARQSRLFNLRNP